MSDSVFKLPLSKKKLVEKTGKNEGKEDDAAGVTDIVNSVENIEILSAKSFSSFLPQLEKLSIVNIEEREKFAKEPFKFYETELELYEMIKRLSAASTDSELLKVMASNGAFVDLLITFLNHPNEDVVESLFEFLNEIFDYEDVTDDAAISIYLFVENLALKGFLGILLDVTESYYQQKDRNQEIITQILEVMEKCIWWRDEKIIESQSIVEGWSIWLLNACFEESPYREDCANMINELILKFDAVRTFLVSNGAADLVLSEINPKTTDINYMRVISDISCALFLNEEAVNHFVNYGAIEKSLDMICGKKEALSQIGCRLLSLIILEQPSVSILVSDERWKELLSMLLTDHPNDQLVEYILAVLGAISITLKDDESVKKSFNEEHKKRIIQLFRHFVTKQDDSAELNIINLEALGNLLSLTLE